VAQQALVVDAAVEVERAAGSDFGAGTFLNFIFLDWRWLGEFGRLRKRCREGAKLVMRRDQLLRTPYWGIRRHRSREFRGLCLAKDSKRLKEEAIEKEKVNEGENQRTLSGKLEV
jgi:hypothetical protein